MKIEQLNKNDYIWFRASTNSQSFYGEVLELIYNEGKPKAVIQVGHLQITIDDRYEFTLGE